jgi:hypothetical protein
MKSASIHTSTWSAALALTLALLLGQHAQVEARGGRGGVPARSSVHSAQAGRNSNINANRNVNVNRNTNVNVNRNVHVHGGYYGGGYGYNAWGRPVATAAAVTATALAVGAVVASLPPQCTTVMRGPVAYQYCGGTYYQPTYQGSTVQYVVVNPP